MKVDANMKCNTSYRQAKRDQDDQAAGSIKLVDGHNDGLTAGACHPRPPHIPHVTTPSLGAGNFLKSDFGLIKTLEGDIRI